MDVTALRNTFEVLAATAETGRFNAPAPDEWSAELVVAHAIATNRTLVVLGMQLLDGRDTSYEGGTLSVQSAWLESIVQSAGTCVGLVNALRQSYEELLALALHFDEATANKSFPAVIFDGRGNILFEGPLTFAALLLKFLTAHMRSHTEQIKALVEVGPAC